MPGFIVEIANNNILGNFGSSRMDGRIDGTITDGKTYSITRYTINKFLNDKAFYEDENYIVVTEGVILNSLNLQKQYLGSDESSYIKMAKTAIEMYKKKGETFFSDFRGSFSGVFYDKQSNIWLIYTNHIGDKQLFYTQTNNGIAFASELTWLSDYRKNNNFSYSLDVEGAYYILTYGFMIEDHTLFNEIKKINAGKYARIKNNEFTIQEYYQLNNSPNERESENEIIENLDYLFKKAIKLEYDKDKEYGYKHFASLSGGLDSRMNVLVAHYLGYTEQLNWTMSQTNYLDEKIAKKIASDFNHEWIFKALDNGTFLCGIVDEMIDLQFGTIIYSGSAHSRSFIKNFNCSDYGLEHTGQLGDAVLGSYLTNVNKKNNSLLGEGAYSQVLIERLSSFKLKGQYENTEIFKFYNRGFTGILQGNMITQEYTEVASPFLDIDFMNYCLHIPNKYRLNEQIYIKWILKKYPQAAKYKWEKINARINAKWINILGRHILLKDLPIKILNKLVPFTKRNKSAKKNGSMNPSDYWYATNPSLKADLDNYYNETLNCVSKRYDSIKKDIELLYKGCVIDKLLALTLLGALKKYF